MELAQQIISRQEEERLEQERLEQERLEQEKARSPRVFGIGGDVRVFFGDTEIGTIQAIDGSLISNSDPHEFGGSGVIERQETFIARSYEGTVSMENTEVNRSMLQEMLVDELTTMSMSYIWEGQEQAPNRAERRKKPKQKRAEDSDDKYRKGLRNMLGGRKRWN